MIPLHQEKLKKEGKLVFNGTEASHTPPPEKITTEFDPVSFSKRPNGPNVNDCSLSRPHRIRGQHMEDTGLSRPLRVLLLAQSKA